MSYQGVLLHSTVKNFSGVELTRIRRFNETSEKLVSEDFDVHSIVSVCRNKVLLSTLSVSESSIRLYDWEKRKHLFSLKNRTNGRVSWCVKRMRRPYQHLVLCDDGKSITVWNFFLKKGHRYTFHERFVEDIVHIEGGGSQVVSGDDGGNIIIWDVENPLRRNNHCVSKDWVMSLDYSESMKLLFVGCRDGKLITFDPRRMRKKVGIVAEEPHCLTRIRYIHDEPLIITGNKYGRISIYDLRKNNSLLMNKNMHNKSWIWRIEQLGRGSKYFASCGSDNYLKLWRIQSNGIKIIGSKMGGGHQNREKMNNTSSYSYYRRRLKKMRMVGLAYTVDLSIKNEELESYRCDLEERVKFLLSTCINGENSFEIVIYFFSVKVPKTLLFTF